MLCISIVIVFTLCLELSLEKLEEKIERDFHFFKETWKKVLDELLVFGIVSLVMFICQEWLDVYHVYHWVLALEFAHVLLFFTAIIQVNSCEQPLRTPLGSPTLHCR